MDRRQFVTTGGVTAVSLFFNNRLHGLSPQTLEPNLNVQGWSGGAWAIGVNGSVNNGWAIGKNKTHNLHLPFVSR